MASLQEVFKKLEEAVKANPDQAKVSRLNLQG